MLFAGVNELAPFQFCLILGIAILYLFMILRIILVKILCFKIKSTHIRTLTERILFNLFLLTKNYLTAKLVEVKNLMVKRLCRNFTVTSSLIQKASQRLNAKDIQWFVGFSDGDGYLSVYKEKKLSLIHI